MITVLCDEHIHVPNRIHSPDEVESEYGDSELVDEFVDDYKANVPFGVNFETVGDQLYWGATDQEILQYAKSNQLLIMTNDTDFLDADLSDGQTGILYLPNNRISATEIESIVMAVCQYLHTEDEFYGEVIWLTRDWLKHSQ